MILVSSRSFENFGAIVYRLRVLVYLISINKIQQDRSNGSQECRRQRVHTAPRVKSRRDDYEDLSPDKKRQKRGKKRKKGEKRKEKKKTRAHRGARRRKQSGAGREADARQLCVVEGSTGR